MKENLDRQAERLFHEMFDFHGLMAGTYVPEIEEDK